jgi:hypothetical protein
MLIKGFFQKLHEELGKIHPYTRGHDDIAPLAKEANMSHRPNRLGSDIPTLHRAAQGLRSAWM